jgi:hypothetical protein
LDDVHVGFSHAAESAAAEKKLNQFNFFPAFSRSGRIEVFLIGVISAPR